MAEYSREDVVRKITALLRLAERGGTKEEAFAAAAKAQDLMHKYEIEQAALEVDDKEKEEPIIDFSEKAEGQVENMGKKVSEWRFRLVKGIARANGCFVFTSYRGFERTIEIVGRPSNVTTVRYMYQWLEKEIQTICEFEGMGMGRVWCREFKEGAAIELGKILEEQNRKSMNEMRAANQTSLVKINTAIIKVEERLINAAKYAYQKHAFSRRTVGHRGNSQTAREAGAQAVRSINLGSSKTKKIGNRSKTDYLLD